MVPNEEPPTAHTGAEDKHLRTAIKHTYYRCKSSNTTVSSQQNTRSVGPGLQDLAVK